MADSTGRPITAIDIGSSKVAILVASMDAAGELTLLGGAEVPAAGLRAGAVVSLDATTRALIDALDRADAWCDEPVAAAYMSLSGQHLRSQNVRAATAVSGPGGEVAPQDIARAITVARSSLRLPENGEVVHLIPRGYALDGQQGVRNPLGMAGITLEVEVHAVTGQSSSIQNLIKCASAARVEPLDLAATPLAASEGTLQHIPDALSIAIADLGAETLSLAILADGAPWQSTVLPVGGRTLTRAVARELNLPLTVAEALKCRHGHCDPESIADDDLIELPAPEQDEQRTEAGAGEGAHGEMACGTRAETVLPRRVLAEILRAQAQDYVEALRPRLYAAQRAGVQPAALVITGGGAALAGLDTLLEQALYVPVHTGRPAGIRGMPATLARPALVVASGLLRRGARQQREVAPELATRRARLSVPGLVAGARYFVSTVLS